MSEISDHQKTEAEKRTSAIEIDTLKSTFFSHRNLVTQIEQATQLTAPNLSLIETSYPDLYNAIIDILIITKLPEVIRLEIIRNPKNIAATLENHQAQLHQTTIQALERISAKLSVHDTIQTTKAAIEKEL